MNSNVYFSIQKNSVDFTMLSKLKEFKLKKEIDEIETGLFFLENNIFPKTNFFIFPCKLSKVNGGKRLVFRYFWYPKKKNEFSFKNLLLFH